MLLFAKRTVLPLLLAFLLLQTSSCIKSAAEQLEMPRAMRISLESFYSDTSLFQAVQFDDQVLVNEARTVAGSLNRLYQSPTGGLILRDSVRIKVTVVKKNNPNLVFDSLVFMNNVNDFLLLQLDPKKKPVFINKRLENATLQPPASDSIKIRLYISAADNITNPKNNNSKVNDFELQLYHLEEQAGNLVAVKDKLIKGIKLEQLSDYISLADQRQYGYDLRDGRSGLAESKRIIQTYRFTPDQGDIDFTRGQLGKASRASGKFQTLRITTTFINDINGTDIKGFNGVYLFSLN